MAPGPASFWDSVRAWADAAGLLLPQDQDQGHRPTVPQVVCDNCPICQGAATLDQVNPDVVNELAELARTVVLGFGSALGSAAEQRRAGPTPDSVVGEAEEPAAGGSAPSAPATGNGPSEGAGSPPDPDDDW
ncbi:MAG: hypothetical protein MUF35_08815 [Candidatus Nanopelagicales bacterium]|jgi:hypothetical protein|nr:hypothetical protein [Candidatus Nanopelagicales bacterium]